MAVALPDASRGKVNRLTAELQDAALEARYLDDRRETDLRRIRTAAGLAFLISLIFAALDWMVVTENLVVVLAIRFLMGCIGAALMYAMTYVRLFQTRFSLFAWIILGIMTLSYFMLIAASNAPDAYLSGYIIILMFLYFLFPISYRASTAVGLVCGTVFAAGIPLVREIDPGQLLTIYLQYAVTLLAGGFALYQVNILRRHAFLDTLQIDEQKRQYFDLLTRILPESIVQRIENGETQIADRVPEAVVLFADIVGFTEMAARNPPEDVVRVLNGLFEKFDDRVSAHGLEKIKTIGDAYMVAGSVPEPRPDSVAAAADLALDMLDIADRHAGPNNEPVQIRIGLHAGSLLAGVIGKKRFGYDLWGDTVNLASRMQTSAAAGTIHVSPAVRETLESRYNFKPLGKVSLKGLGEMHTWQLISRSQGPGPASVGTD